MVDVIVTAGTNAAPRYNLSGFTLSADNITSQTRTIITASYGEFTITFRGDFSYDAAGTLTLDSGFNSFDFTHDGASLISATGLDLQTGDVVNGNFDTLMDAALSGNDTYTSAWASGENIDTYGGNDTIRAGTGNDTIDGGTGYDTLIIPAGANEWSIGWNFDRGVNVTSPHGDDRITNVERIEFEDQTAVITEGNESDDRLVSTQNDVADALWDMMNGRGGDDTIQGGGGRDFLIGDDGHDVIYGGANRDYISGGVGNDHLYGQSDNDRIVGRTGNDSIYGGTGKDSLHAGDGNDVLFGGLGRDWLAGDLGNDTIVGGSHGDKLIGGGGNDNMRGQNGHDVLRGNSGWDQLLGGRGNDRIYGDGGQDRLIGQEGYDTLTGGAHADTFVFHRGYGTDIITDFTVGEDRIQIGRGADGMDDLTFTSQGNSVQITFADVTIMVENSTLAQIEDADNFLF
ncbi:calcium-binding protein [Phaeobacter inhibens]|uniref:calcium-binding protein n=1 Tax=Phaeobacter inhibens TaxID=221822 RepID=UPI0021A5841E|nr:calcium-binding protein [Phaeobacter inhibens]UWR90225.1 calcium-binding protein [Phaeobacter inhibens]